ncbi:MAG: glycosyltransferase family 2 protein [Thermodesulfobacteriota bacterium]
MAKLSVTIIALNEEANIRGCLTSVRWADEIIVSDSGSSDRTVDICKEYGAKVFQDEWLGFGKQKNLCSERACNDWILNIDADERVTSELRVEIEKALQEDRCDGLYIPRKSFFLGKWIKYCGWYPDYNLRLFRKGKGAFTERRVHEAVEFKGETAYLKYPLEHHTYKTISDYIQRMDRYAGLAAEEMAANGRKASYLDILLRPELTFFKMFFLKMGFLEGYRGLILSSLYAAYTLSKYARLWEIRCEKR